MQAFGGTGDVSDAGASIVLRVLEGDLRIAFAIFPIFRRGAPATHLRRRPTKTPGESRVNVPACTVPFFSFSVQFFFCR